jgi:hypothetical protein
MWIQKICQYQNKKIKKKHHQVKNSLMKCIETFQIHIYIVPKSFK